MKIPCPRCGGSMIGDGYSKVAHCEFVDPYPDAEPDADPIYCDYRDDDNDGVLF